MNTATLVQSTTVTTLIPLSKGWNDGYYHVEWLPVHPLSLEYMKGYRLGWLAKSK
jgi:hypothetical protein